MSGGSQDDYPDAAEVSRHLALRIQDLCGELLAGGKRKGGYWSVGGVDGSAGKSMWVHLYGGKAGHWTDAASGEFGDALDLLAACRYRGDKKAAYWGALEWLGWDIKRKAPDRQMPAPRRVDDSDRDAKKRAYALRLWLESQPSVRHTPVAEYLGRRGIDLGGLGRQPRALRYHPGIWHPEARIKCPAMIAAISGPDGAHLATHRTYLERTGGGWIKLRGVEDAKLSLAPFAGGSIRIQRGATGKPLKDMRPDEWVVIGEGIETCLSIAIACPELRVLSAVSLGNMGSVWLPDQCRFVLLAADNDDKPGARAGLQRAVNRHIERGRVVRVAHAEFGSDFNDVLQGVA